MSDIPYVLNNFTKTVNELCYKKGHLHTQWTKKVKTCSIFYRLEVNRHCKFQGKKKAEEDISAVDVK